MIPMRYFYWVIMSILICRKCQVLFATIHITNGNPGLNSGHLSDLQWSIQSGMIMMPGLMISGLDHILINRSGRYLCWNISGETGIIRVMEQKNGRVAGTLSP